MGTAQEPPPPGGSGASGPTVRLRLAVAYDGSGFHGFAENVGVRTVAGSLRGAIERVLGEPVVLTCAGRTDTGVHAQGQVVTVDVRAPGPQPIRLRDSINALVGPAVVVHDVDLVPDGMDARFSARWRMYRYHVLNRATPDPFLAATSWWVPTPLDPDALERASAHLLGEHDFSSFCRRPRRGPEVSLVRRVLSARWIAEPTPGLLRFEIAGSAFCHQMVRSVVGTLVAVGLGRIDPDSMPAIIEARDRAVAGNLAPPRGLCLWQVGYRDWESAGRSADAASTDPA